MHNELFGEAIFRAGRGFLFWYCGKFARATPSRNFYKILIPRKIFVTAATSSRSPKTKEVCDVRAHHSNCSALSGGWRSYAGWRHLSGVRKFKNLDQCITVAGQQGTGGATSDLSLSRGVYWYCAYTGAR
jgi:hypothetical protein